MMSKLTEQQKQKLIQIHGKENIKFSCSWRRLGVLYKMGFRYCSKCGYLIKSDNLFCSECGKRMRKSIRHKK